MENLQELSLEELSQKQEGLEKDNEQLRRENQLFESYIKRKHQEMGQEGESIKEIAGQRDGKHHQRESYDLTSDQKYEVANQELETLKTNIEEGR